MRIPYAALGLCVFLGVTRVSAQASSRLSNSSSQALGAPGALLLTVSDKMGNPLPPPTKGSVQLRVGGKTAEIEDIRSLKNAPLYFSVLVDLSGSSRQFADQQIGAASTLFRNFSSGENHGYLVLFKSKVAATDRFISAEEAERILAHFPANSRSGGTALYDAILHAVEEQLRPTSVPPRSRRAIFVLSDGGDDASHKSLIDTVEIVQKEDVPIFSFGFAAGDNSVSPAEMRRDREILETLSHSTGGLVSFFTERSDAIARVTTLVDEQCLLSFEPPPLKSRKFYPLKIATSPQNIRMLIPTQYFLP